MRQRRVVECWLGIALTASAALAVGPVAVSPGGASRMVLIEGRCPTFSWSASPDAKAYELAVWRVRRGTADDVPTLDETIAGAALSWTPALDRCLDRGGRYAWSVRAVYRKKFSAWSAPSLFQVAAPPSEQEFERALEVVVRYLDRGGEARPLPATEPPSESASGEGVADAGARKSRADGAQPPRAIGGADFSIDGAGNVQANSYWGPLDCFGCITEDDIAFHTIGGDVIAENAVSGWHIASGTIVTGDIGLNQIVGGHILPDQISGGHIPDNQIDSDHILNGEVGSADIGSQQINSLHILNGEVKYEDLASAAVGKTKMKGIVPVNVECNGDCGNILLDTVCDAAGSEHQPISVACQYLKDPGGNACGDATCSVGSLGINSDVGLFCTNDVFGWDAIVYCMAP